MRLLSKAILLALSIFLIIIYAISSDNAILHVLLQNTQNSYYTDILVDKNSIFNLISTTNIDKISDDEVLLDIQFMKDFEYQGKKAMQSNANIIGQSNDIVCTQKENACIYTTSLKIPETVQLVLMDKSHNFYVSDDIYITKDNYVKIDFNTMKVTYNRNKQLRYIHLIIWLTLIIEFALQHVVLKKKRYSTVSVNAVTAFIMMIIYGLSLISSINFQYLLGPLTFRIVIILTICYGLQGHNYWKETLTFTSFNILLATLLLVSNPIF